MMGKLLFNFLQKGMVWYLITIHKRICRIILTLQEMIEPLTTFPIN